jgi:hypothetical protein
VAQPGPVTAAPAAATATPASGPVTPAASASAPPAAPAATPAAAPPAASPAATALDAAAAQAHTAQVIGQVNQALTAVQTGLAAELAKVGSVGAKRVQIVLTRPTAVAGAVRAPGFVLGTMLLTPGADANFVGYAMTHGLAKAESL